MPIYKLDIEHCYTHICSQVIGAFFIYVSSCFTKLNQKLIFSQYFFFVYRDLFIITEYEHNMNQYKWKYANCEQE